MRKLLLLTFICLLSASVFADEPLFQFKDPSKHYSIENETQTLEDKTGKLSFQEVQKSGAFTTGKGSVYNFGITSSTYWVKFTINNQSPVENLILEIKYPTLDLVEFYAPDSSGNYLTTASGEFEPFSSRSLKSENYLFGFVLKKNTTKTYYLKVRTSDDLLMPLFISSDNSMFESEQRENIFFGIYFGIILVMALYNTFIYFSVRDSNYAFYVIYIILVGMSQAVLGGYAFRYLWPDFPWMAIQSVNLIPALNGIAVVEFFKSFLKTKEHLPRSHKVLNFINVLYVLAFIISLLNLVGLSTTILQLVGLLGSIFLLYLSIRLVKAGFRPAKFFLFAWTFFFLGIIIFVLRNFGILPFNAFTDHVLLIGSGTEATLLSFALADRINILKIEKEQSQALALSEAQKNELLIRDQNITLEKKVGERTIQLRTAIEELNVTMDDLKNTQAQLVDSEKMASLGQLTAGIAHEINNPINFVTSNINPLKRDIQDVYQLLEKFDSSHERMEPDFVQEINKLKKDLDIGYVKDEIDLLLKGIDEGANRTSEIIRGLKKFSRVDEQDIKEVDLNEGFESTLLLLNSRIKDHIKLALSLGQLPPVECYAGKLNQVFMNIITNSIYAINQRYGDSKEGSLLIKTEVDPENEKRVIVIIRDNGTGMSEETVAKVFDPFFTTKPVGEGTGLGLSIVHKIITAHKGTIDVDSQFGKGTEFKITLPVRQ